MLVKLRLLLFIFRVVLFNLHEKLCLSPSPHQNSVSVTPSQVFDEVSASVFWLSFFDKNYKSYVTWSEVLFKSNVQLVELQQNHEQNNWVFYLSLNV